MKINTEHLKRYKEILQLVWKYGRSDLVQQMAIDQDLGNGERVQPGSGQGHPEQLADDLEAMGPTFVKLGQVLSSRADLLPEPYLKALARLQDSVKPFPYAEVEQIVESELGVRISKAFSRFDPEPIAGASLGQVHTAALRDGFEVVVKVQRPGVEKQIIEDFEVLGTDRGTPRQAHRDRPAAPPVRDARGASRLDHERAQLRARGAEPHQHGENLKEYDLIVIPQPIVDFTTKRVLTMERIDGRKITELPPIARLEMDYLACADQLFAAYLKQVLIDGLFHADPHAGNVFVTEDGRIALLDLGLVGHMTPSMQDHLVKILIAISEGKGEEAADIVIHMSETSPSFELHAFRKAISALVVERKGQALQQINVGATLLNTTRVAADQGLHVPSELTMLGKTLLQLDEVGRILDPKFDPDAAIRHNVTAIMTRGSRATPARAASSPPSST
jgi:predicted unusual protein kinase regulating ubiquinone biosynthesis (AarF/ABC1/UbiB family)